jgi:hypothetical protein
VSQQIVEQAKADLVAAGFDISGNDGAFLITMEAASRIPGAGVLDKPNGNHAGFRGASYAVDIIAFPDGRIVDVLADAGLESRPTWNDGNAPVDRSRFRPAVRILGSGPNSQANPEAERASGDMQQQLQAISAAVATRLDVTQSRLEDIAAAVARLESALADLRNAVQTTDDRVERTYQDLANRLSAI